MSASGQVEMSTLGDVVSLGNRTMAQELVRMSAKELDRVDVVRRVIERGLTQVKAVELIYLHQHRLPEEWGEAEETVVWIR